MTIHAHVSHESQDCDGRYSRTAILLPDASQDEWGFRADIIGNALAYADENTTAHFTEHGFTVSAPTEEGYTFSEFTFCEDDDTDTKSTFRDHSAEAAGY